MNLGTEFPKGRVHDFLGGHPDHGQGRVIELEGVRDLQGAARFNQFHGFLGGQGTTAGKRSTLSAAVSPLLPPSASINQPSEEGPQHHVSWPHARPS